MENKTGKNVSSGAKKVEEIEKEKEAAAVAAGGENARNRKQGTPKKSHPVAKKSVKKAEKEENAAAEKRLNAAKEKARKKEQKLLKKAQLKEKKLEKKAALKEKKLARKAAIEEKKEERRQLKLEKKAALKEKKLARKAEKTARREMLKNESKAEKQKRIERQKREKIALKRQKREQRDRAREQKLKAREAAHARKAQEKKHKREQRTERKKEARGFGGWLAAVISLGVACLALGAIVTAGAFRMNDMTLEAANGYRSTLFEMTSVAEEMEDNLSKLRVSSGANEQRTLLQDLLVDAELMESAIERMPIDSVTGTDISSYVNKTGDYCRTLLGKLAAGETLNATEKGTLEYLYNVNTGLYRELNEMTTHMTEKEFMAFIDGKEGTVSQKFGEIGQGTRKEPEETVDAPFSSVGNVGENKLEAYEEISVGKAEELVRGYFGGYHIAGVQYTGETAAQSAVCYNFSLTEESGNEIFVQLTKNGGKLAFFDTYEDCEDKNFDLDTCRTLATEFLAELGIDDVEAVWASDAGMVADLTFVGVQNGVRIYPELIRVRVCESKGRVIGVDTMGYLLNHEERTIGGALSREEAQEKLSEGLVPYAAHLSVIPVGGKERLAHEFACTYGEEEFLVYLDAETGEEIQVYKVRTSARGSYLR